jgi:hypothetical protein
MAHPDFFKRRKTIATLHRYSVSFDERVVNALVREFGCSVSTIKNDVRLLANQPPPINERLERFVPPPAGFR